MIAFYEKLSLPKRTGHFELSNKPLLSRNPVPMVVTAHQEGTIKVDNSVANCAATACTGAEEAAIFASVDAQAAGTDAVDGDAVSYTGGTFTIDAGDQNAANAQRIGTHEQRAAGVISG